MRRKSFRVLIDFRRSIEDAIVGPTCSDNFAMRLFRAERAMSHIMGTRTSRRELLLIVVVSLVNP